MGDVAPDILELSARAAEFWSFQYAFATNALLASVLVGIVCAVVGVFLVLRGMSLLGDAAGHATLPGVCVAFLSFGAGSTSMLLVGALLASLLASLAVGALSRGARVRPDAAIGMVLSVFFGAGVVLLSYAQNSPSSARAGLQSVLLGNAAAVSPGQVWALLVVGVLLIGGVAAFYRPLTLATFDEMFARSMGVPTSAVHVGLLVALTLSVVVSIQAVGVVLVAAMLIIPPSAGLLLSSRLPIVLVVSGAIGAASAALGAFLSYLFSGVATGPAMVLIAASIFAVALVAGPQSNLRRQRSGEGRG